VRLWESLERLDAYRRRFDEIPAALTNVILLGTLLVPLGFSPQGSRLATVNPHKPGPLSLGILPIPRRDVEHLSHMLALLPRLLDPGPSPRAHRTLLHRNAFADALTWLEIHGNAPDTVGFWRGLQEGAATAEGNESTEGTEAPERRRRRRRRRPRRPAGEPRPPE
jgi:hypothetical protein